MEKRRAVVQKESKLVSDHRVAINPKPQMAAEKERRTMLVFILLLYCQQNSTSSSLREVTQL